MCIKRLFSPIDVTIKRFKKRGGRGWSVREVSRIIWRVPTESSLFDVAQFWTIFYPHIVTLYIPTDWRHKIIYPSLWSGCHFLTILRALFCHCHSLRSTGASKEYIWKCFSTFFLSRYTPWSVWAQNLHNRICHRRKKRFHDSFVLYRRTS